MNFDLNFYKEYNLNSASQRFVSKLWCLNNLHNKESTQTKFILPNGCHNLAIIEGFGANVTTKRTSYYLTPGCYLASQMTSKVTVELSQNTRITLIQLYPWTVSAISNFNLSSFTDSIEEVDQYFLGKEIFLNTENQREIKELVLEIEQLFTILANDSKAPLTELICKEVLAKKGICKVTDIVSNYEESQRSIQYIFKKSTGLTLKQYISIIKLRAAVDNISTSAYHQSLIANTAVDYDYFDQTHFIKAFKKIAQITPSKFDQHSFILSKIKN